MFFFSPTGLGIEQTMLKNLKELSDGEIKVAISTVNMTLEVRVGKLFLAMTDFTQLHFEQLELFSLLHS